MSTILKGMFSIMKKFISLICVLAIVCACFCACSKIPDQPASSTVVNYSVITDAVTAAADDTSTTAPSSTEAASAAESTTEAESTSSKYLSDYDCIIADYYTYNKSYAKILDISIKDYGVGKPTAYAVVEMSGIAFGEDEFKIGYHCYNAAGEVVRTSYLLAPISLRNLKEGDTTKCRFDVAEGTVKVEFVEYSTVADIWSD